MFYTIEHNNVRWIFSEQESNHLFTPYDRTRQTVHIKVSGTWNEGLTFKPVILPKFNKLNGPHGPFLVHRPPHGDERQIVTPVDVCKLNRFALAVTAKAAEVQANMTSKPAEIHVYPQRIVGSGPTTTTTIEEQSTAYDVEADVGAARQQAPNETLREGEPAADIELIMENAERFGFSTDDARHDLVAQDLIREAITDEEKQQASQSTTELQQSSLTEESAEGNGEEEVVTIDQEHSEGTEDKPTEDLGDGDRATTTTEVVKDPPVQVWTWSSTGKQPDTTREKPAPVPTKEADITRAIKLVQLLNPLIAKFPEITVLPSSDGRSLRLSKRVVKVRRHI